MLCWSGVASTSGPSIAIAPLVGRIRRKITPSGVLPAAVGPMTPTPRPP